MDVVWICLISVRCSSAGLVVEFSIWCRSIMVLCISLMLNVTALMAECLYVLASTSLLKFAFDFVCVICDGCGVWDLV
jgi:hypothetical protein